MSQLIDNLNTIESIKTDIKTAIENKGVDMTGVSFPGYASKIGEISGGGGVNPSGTLEISENGVYDVYSYASASVDVHPSASLSETYISNGNYNITGEFNGGVITVDVPAPQFVTETLNVSANGTYNPGEGIDGYSQVVVDVPQSVTGFTEKEITEGVQIVNLSNSASYVASNVFAHNSHIETVYLPNCISIYSMAFDHCTHLQSVNLPLCLKIGRRTTNIRVDNNCFNACTSLKYVSLPSCIEIGASCFQDCVNLISIDLPVCEWISPNAFAGCTRLEKVNLSVCSFLGNSAFNTCTSLSELYIYTSSVCSLEGTRTFSKNTCLIYVPSSLVDVYKSATNWSVFSSRIFPIPE